MNKIFLKLRTKLKTEDGFLKSVAVLVGGNTLAQVLTLLALPVLTRLYTPEDFSILAIYMSIVGLVGGVSCLRFEIAIPHPKQDIDALSLLVLALLSNFIFFIILLLLLCFFENSLEQIVSNTVVFDYLWLLPVGIFFSSFYNVFQYWAVRKKEFNIVAKSRISQSVTGNSTQILFGLIGGGIFGLLLGHILNLSAGIVSFLKYFFVNIKFIYKNLTLNKILENLKEYQNYPKYSTLEALANNAGIQLPIILIATFAIGAEAGFLMLATKVMAIPVKFIGSAVAQVFLGSAAEEYRKGTMKKYTVLCIKKIAKIGVFPLIVICSIAPLIFPYIFGQQWSRSGDMVIWMLPWFIMQLITSPISLSLNIIGLQKIALILQIIGFFLRTIGLLVIVKINTNILFEYYAVSSFIFYFIYFSVIIYCISYSDSKVVKV